MKYANQALSKLTSESGMLMFAVMRGTVDSLLKTNTLIKSAAPLGSMFSMSTSIL